MPCSLDEFGTARVLALQENWRKHLCRDERRPVGSLAGAYDGAEDLDGTVREYGRSGRTYGPVRRLIIRMGRAWRDNLGEKPPVIFPAKAEQKAA